jgi:hypothetical protein
MKLRGSDSADPSPQRRATASRGTSEASPLHEHHQEARHGAGELGAVVGLDERQGEVDPSGRPR